MTRPILTLVIIVAAAGLVAGALAVFNSGAGVEGAETGAKLKVGGAYEFSLESNVTTGYAWFPKFDETYVELVDRRYEDPSSPALGASGRDVFTFRGLRPGTTTVTFEYKRPWERAVEKTRELTLEIE